MIDYVTWHAVLGSILALSSLGLLIVTWQLIEVLVVGIEDALPVDQTLPRQGAFILSLRLPKFTVMFAYRLTFASQTL